MLYNKVNIDINLKEQMKVLNPFFKTDDFILYNEDSLELMSKFPDNYIDMIFADPPYMLSNDGFSCQNGRTQHFININNL